MSACSAGACDFAIRSLKNIARPLLCRMKTSQSDFLSPRAFRRRRDRLEQIAESSVDYFLG